MRGVLLDAPSVIEGAKDVFEAHGAVNRCELVGGDFFTSVPAGGDAYIINNIITRPKVL